MMWWAVGATSMGSVRISTPNARNCSSMIGNRSSISPAGRWVTSSQTPPRSVPRPSSTSVAIARATTSRVERPHPFGVVRAMNRSPSS